MQELNSCVPLDTSKCNLQTRNLQMLWVLYTWQNCHRARHAQQANDLEGIAQQCILYSLDIHTGYNTQYCCKALNALDTGLCDTRPLSSSCLHCPCPRKEGFHACEHLQALCPNPVLQCSGDSCCHQLFLTKRLACMQAGKPLGNVVATQVLVLVTSVPSKLYKLCPRVTWYI